MSRAACNKAATPLNLQRRGHRDESEEGSGDGAGKVDDVIDADFEVMEERQAELQVRLRIALQSVVELAMEEKPEAALICTEYHNCDAPQLFAEILEACSFAGALVAIGVDEQCLLSCSGDSPATDGITPSSRTVPKPDGWGDVQGKHIIWAGATQAFLIGGDHRYFHSVTKFTTAHGQLAGALASAAVVWTE